MIGIIIGEIGQVVSDEKWTQTATRQTSKFPKSKYFAALTCSHGGVKANGRTDTLITIWPPFGALINWILKVKFLTEWKWIYVNNITRVHSMLQQKRLIFSCSNLQFWTPYMKISLWDNKHKLELVYLPKGKYCVYPRMVYRQAMA